jgi:hypothetical protein
MSAAVRPQKITFGDMRDMGVRGVRIYCVPIKMAGRIILEPNCA